MVIKSTANNEHIHNTRRQTISIYQSQKNYIFDGNSQKAQMADNKAPTRSKIQNVTFEELQDTSCKNFSLLQASPNKRYKSQAKLKNCAF